VRFGNFLNGSASPHECNSLYAFVRNCFCGLRPQKLSWLLFAILASTPVIAQDVKQVARYKAVEMEKNLESPMNYTAVHYQSGNRRDPFLNPLLLKNTSKQGDEEITRGLPPPGIAGTYIEQLILQGTCFCADERRVAIVRGADDRAYFLREGDRLFDGYLKSVQIDSIVLVRETKLRSGKTLTQDVTKRLRTP
jgi:Tfp pilus assembly protein PilP